MKNNMKLIQFCTFLIFVILQSFTSIAENNSEYVNAYVAKNFTIKFNENVYIPRDETGIIVYPLLITGSTYLPIRAMSKLSGIDVQWDSNSKTIILNQNMDSKVNPDSSGGNILPETADKIQAKIESNFKITFNGKPFISYDVNGKVIYPIVFNGTTYLPIRAISNLAGLNVEWKGSDNTINLSSTQSSKTDEKGNLLEVEQNNTLETSMMFPVNSSIKGSIFSVNSNDKDLYDYYKLIIPSEGLLKLTVTTSSTTIPLLYLYNNNGSSLRSDTKSPKDNRLIEVPLQKGTYYVMIKSSKLCDYILKNDFSPLEIQTEPNNQKNTSYKINLNQSIKGLILGSDDLSIDDTDDYYSFSVKTASNIDISILRDSPNSDMLYLYDDKNNIVSKDLNTAVNKHQIEILLKPGTYYILIKNKINEGYYTLSVNTKN